MKITKVEMKDSRGVTWAAHRGPGDDQWSVYRDGDSGFKLKRKRDGRDSVWRVFNDAPYQRQYEDDEAYVTALARGEHKAPEIAARRFGGDSFFRILSWAVLTYKKRGWRVDENLEPISIDG